MANGGFRRNSVSNMQSMLGWQLILGEWVVMIFSETEK
jgi:hypothetical protein